jgi:hypothetical protein
MEYQVLMTRSRDAERTAQYCWTASGLAAAILLSWGIAAKSSSLMLPVVLAVAFGFYAKIHARHEIRLIAGYVKEFFESQGQGPQWFTRLGHLEVVPGFSSSGDWVSTALANAVIVASVVFGWFFSATSMRGELMAGIVTGCGLIFCFHSISETGRVRQSNPGALWRQVGAATMEEPRKARFAGR